MPLERCPECHALRAHLSGCSVNSQQPTGGSSFELDASDRKWRRLFWFLGFALLAVNLRTMHRDSWSHGYSLLYAAIFTALLVLTVRDFLPKRAPKVSSRSER